MKYHYVYDGKFPKSMFWRRYIYTVFQILIVFALLILIVGCTQEIQDEGFPFSESFSSYVCDGKESKLVYDLPDDIFNALMTCRKHTNLAVNGVGTSMTLDNGTKVKNYAYLCE